MRQLFFAATGIFWLGIMAFAIAGTSARTVESKTPAATPRPAIKAVVAEKRFTLAEVAGHAAEADCWMAIDGVVYDVTAYLPEHPSRPSIVLPWCGKEATDAYKTKTKGRPHSAEADQLLPTYRIGRLDPP
jgi:cytochrome b involved in lipid metabolism